ncbi:MAG: hypothetical protein KatS3mg035_2183 [Bacteroidia bacterium]|nr:MAG: hypothetical protein KatS3mg035_2183 [Bacteroidia bacterium]
MKKPTQNSIVTPVIITADKPPAKTSIYPLGKKHYESTDRLGNVRVTYTDKKSWQQNKFALNLSSSQDYYPFGSVMEGRNLETINYRFGFQGQEGDDEVYGKNNLWAYKYRLHDARLGRFFSVDPLADKYPYNSVYAFSENRVIDGVELEGLELVYTRNGQFIGKYGQSTEIRVLDEEKVNKYAQEMNMMSMQKLDWWQSVGGILHFTEPYDPNKHSFTPPERIMVITRTHENEKATLGEFAIYKTGEENPQALVTGYTLEPPGPSTTESGKNRRIPTGYYKTQEHRWSGGSEERGNDKVPLLSNNDVPSWRLILIHTGNYPGETEGCILCGSSQTINPPQVLNSLDKFKEIKKQIEEAGGYEKFDVLIEENFQNNQNNQNNENQ